MNKKAVAVAFNIQIKIVYFLFVGIYGEVCGIFYAFSNNLQLLPSDWEL